jgi:NAD(P)-dependent dehydrogenase (short-subunit alcohol dehydrogenase family)
LLPSRAWISSTPPLQAPGRCSFGKRWARTRPCVPGPGFRKDAAGRGYQHHGYDLPHPQGRQRYASPELRQNSDHRIARRFFTPGSFQAVYNGTKAFLNSFSFALREELRDTKVTVTCLMPGATETEFFRRAEMMDTAVGTAKKDDPAEVANNGFDTMMKGEGDVVSGLKNKVQSAAANVTPAGILASQHRKMAEPGTAKK